MPSPRPSLSVVIITLNCAPQLAACLDSVAFAEEILLIDSGSNDGTVELAQKWTHKRGVRVVHQDWLGFGKQKQSGVEQASHDWVLCIDSDERVTPELKASIEEALATPSFQAYRFARSNRFMGRYLRHGEGYPDWSLRLFHRAHARWSDDVVHEKVLVQQAVGTLRGDLLHDTAENLETYLAKQNRYTTLAAESALASGRRATPAHLLLSPLLRFVKFYFVRLGLLDGLPGLAHIAIGCHNSFIKYAKMLDLQREKYK